MTTDMTPAGSATELEVARLQRRVDRERRARLEAEALAEKGMRALYETNQDLDRRVQERAAESVLLANRAAQAERVKAEILASLSHELRTPLMAVVGALDLMQSETDEENTYLTAAMDGATRLRSLVDDLFTIIELADSTTGPDLQPVELSSFVDSLADRWRMPALQNGLLLVTSIEQSQVTAHIDADRTRTAVDRLIDNAIKYSRSGTVTVATEVTDGFLKISVGDEGPGIEQDRLAGLLEPFEVGDRSSTRADDGVGLGLAVAGGLVELMGGRLEIDSEPDRGTTVGLVLPIGSDLDLPAGASR